jgi:hypothetical protein
MDCGPNPEWFPVVQRFTWIGNVSFISRRNMAGPSAHRPWPSPFPEGELFHSPGLTRSGYPWVGDFAQGLRKPD